MSGISHHDRLLWVACCRSPTGSGRARSRHSKTARTELGSYCRSRFSAEHRMEQQLSITVTELADANDIALISEGLDKFNVVASGTNDRRELAVLAKDPKTMKTVGGLLGRTSLGLLFVDLFFLPPALRGSGLGTKILGMAEDEGRARGCRSGV